MNIMTIIGLFLGAGTTVIDRYLYKLPNWLAIVLYLAAVILIIMGMIVSRKA